MSAASTAASQGQEIPRKDPGEVGTPPADSGVVIGHPRADATPFEWSRRRIAPVLAEGGAVASCHPLVTSTGLRILAQGGNAVDAAVGAALVASVVMPEMCGLGGDLFALVHDPAVPNVDGGSVTSFQGSGIAPRAATIEAMRQARDGVRMPSNGPLSVTVPGMVHAYFTLLERHGTKQFAELVQPAVNYAYGHPISPVLISFIRKFTDLLASFPASAKVFLPEGAPPVPGSVFRQTDLARTLETIAAGGPEAFYQGEIAERIGAFMAQVGGALAAADFKDHRTDVSAPISTTYRGHRVFQTCPPSQGLVMLEALNIAENFDLPALGAASPDRPHVLIESIKLAFADRYAYCGDPAFLTSPVEQLLSKDWARERSARIGARAGQEVLAGEFDRGHTTYLCVVDRNGMMVSLIQSVASNFGSGVVAGDTGVVLNNRAQAFSLAPESPNVFAPGKKPMHTLNCYQIADPQGRLVVTGGTPGGDRQPQWNLQTVTGMIDHGFDTQQSIEQPFWFGSSSAGANGRFELALEGRAGQEYAAALADRGHDVSLNGDWSCESGAQIISRDPATGVLAGGSDPRSEGQVIGL
ncbi:gamma-glutamyltransferase [Actinopolymorpha pittospori]|uniref:Glutathione hydrolase proenzyme n=1 Tax=Actinopolymorpha pittospori TaxID=648752 RepID=A0A927N401_9ACTN|nr:gamma-glutamyltransferase [Actinopolymorpha pittospori]MBE1611317.1 gamma-glutamyltranspeptidase/glutathione hydrolase [Actinopolymorpha pittospori]